MKIDAYADYKGKHGIRKTPSDWVGLVIVAPGIVHRIPGCNSKKHALKNARALIDRLIAKKSEG
jgi:hypothetical protein